VKVYAAWSVGATARPASAWTIRPARALISFAYDRKATFVDSIRPHIDLDDVDLMLDSGAFSVWTSGETIDLDAYIAWASNYYSEFDSNVVVINLDVIPGTPTGGAPSTRERNAAVKKSMRNADTIRAAGLPVMEVYHLHEPIRVLGQLLERRQPGELVGLGGLAGRGDSGLKMQFCRDAFRLLYERNGRSWKGIVPLHGLGISPDAPMGKHFPWWSIDSSSWSIFHRFGAEVARNGRAQKRSTGATREKGQRGLAAFRPASDLYYIRTLRRWRRLESDYTAMWRRRGVSFAADMKAVRV
jgi:hypothetical protein